MTQTPSAGGFSDITEDPSSPYYVGPIHSTQMSGDQIRNVSSLLAGLAGIAGPVDQNALTQQIYETQISNARQDLADGLQLRNPGSAPQTMWENATHQQMVDAINQNANSATVAQSSEEWVALGNELTDHQRTLASAIEDSMSDWQGEGGDAVRQHLASVGKWLGNTASGATLTGRQQEIHSQTLNETQKRMAANPPVEFSPDAATAQLAQIKDPVQFAAQAAADAQLASQQQAAREEAARTMTQFDSTIASAVSTPEFAAPPKLAQSSPAQITNLPGGAGAPPLGSGAGLPNGSGAGGAGVPPLPGGGGAGGAGVSPAPSFAAGGGPGGAGAPPLDGGSGPFGGGSGNGNIPPLSGGDLPGGASTGSFGGPGDVNIPPLSGGDLPAGSDNTTASSFDGLPSSIANSGGVASDGIANRLGGGLPPATQFPTGNAPGLGNVPGIGGAGGGLGGLGGLGAGAAGAGGGGDTPRSSRIPGSGGFGAGGGGDTPRSSRIPGSGGFGAGGGGDTPRSSRIPGSGGGASGAAGDEDALRSSRGAGSGGALRGGSGLGSGSGSGSGAGLRSGAGSGAANAAASEEAAATRGSGATTGRPTTPASGMGHGAGKKGEEDKEHRTASYIEGDPEIFQPDEVVAPPVIGDWKKNKKKPGDGGR